MLVKGTGEKVVLGACEVNGSVPSDSGYWSGGRDESFMAGCQTGSSLGKLERGTLMALYFDVCSRAMTQTSNFRLHAVELIDRCRGPCARIQQRMMCSCIFDSGAVSRSAPVFDSQ